MRICPSTPSILNAGILPKLKLGDGVKCGGEQTVRVVVTQATWDKVAPKIRPRDDVKPEGIYEELNIFLKWIPRPILTSTAKRN